MSAPTSKAPSSAESVHLAAFGKHPGWDDHLADIGMDSERLVALKRSLYIEGVGGNVDGGAWERLDPAQRLAGFGHTFIAREPRSLAVGRMWASRDGKGRARYPMVVCAEGSGASIPWLLAQFLPALAQVEAGCKAAPDAAGVTALMESQRAALRHTVAASAEPVRRSLPDWVQGDNVLATVADWVAAGAAPVGFHRVLYKVQREMAAYQEPWPPARGSARPAQHLRVPLCAGDEARAIALWCAMMLTLLHESTPLILVLPTGRPWLDVLVGEPKTAQWYCLLASLEALPLACDVPYTLEPDFVKRTNALVSKWRRGLEDANPGVLQIEDANGAGADRAGVKRWIGPMKSLFDSRS